MTFLPEVCGHILEKKAMDPRESLHVADLGKTNFSAAMSNVEEPKGGMLRTPDSLKPGLSNVGFECILQKGCDSIGLLKMF